MTGENCATLLRAYRAAIDAGQDIIADDLEDVILSLMEERDVTLGVEPYQDCVQHPQIVATPLVSGTWVGIDPLSHTTTAGASV